MRNRAFFCENYQSASEMFRSVASHNDAQLTNYSVARRGEAGEPLFVDIATIGSANPDRIILITAGIHGIEGTLGSAIQLRVMRGLYEGRALPKSCAIVLVHALNPFGYSWRRRTDEENIDLNRNFLCAPHSFSGISDSYRAASKLLNPDRAPSRLAAWRNRLFMPKAVLVNFANDIAVGQYEIADGLFFGGMRPSGCQVMLKKHVGGWVGNASKIIHFDLHSGFRRWGELTLFSCGNPSPERTGRLHSVFGSQKFRYLRGDPPIYNAKGIIGDWLAEELARPLYEYVATELGTYPLREILSALIEENCAHFHSSPENIEYRAAKLKLLECYVPASYEWRETVVERVSEVVMCARACPQLRRMIAETS